MSDPAQPGPEQEPLTIYAVRTTVQAERDIQEAIVRTDDLSGSDIARQWVVGLYEAFATLATLPRRCPVARENSLFQSDVRQLQYRRSGSAAVYRVLFRILDPDESEDGPVVSIIHVRHGSRKPMTRKEAREIQGAD